MFKISGKVIIITGGCGGIAKAHTKALLENNVKGIGLLDINEEAGQALMGEYSKEFGNKVIFIKCDVTKLECMREAFQAVINNFKQLDVVINNAGIIDEIDVNRAFTTNVTGVINGSTLAKEFLPKFKKENEGMIINTASIAGLVPFPCLDIYSATKAAIISYGRSLGSFDYYKIDKIKVITLCPGGTESDLISERTLKNSMRDNIKLDFAELLKVTPFQSPDILAKKLIEIIKKANHGDIWAVHKGEAEIVNFPMLFTV